MKNNAFMTLLAFLLALVILYGCNATRPFEAASSANTIQAYETFLEKHPKSKYADEASSNLKLLYEDKDWNDARVANTVTDYKAFLVKYPSGRYVSQAEAGIATLIDQEWTMTLNSNTIVAYEVFNAKYPDSKYVTDAKKRIRDLQEEIAWQKATDDGTIPAYKHFLSGFPEGNYMTRANEKLFELEVILPQWEQAQEINTTDGYKQFLEKYPSCSYAGLAKDKLREIEDNQWNNTSQINTASAYREFLALFPDGSHAVDAERKIVDMEVDSVMHGRYGSLPSMNKVSDGYRYDDSNEVEIYNNTGYNLTVLYSGTDSKKITFAPHETRTFKIKNGSYRVAAWVDASGVSSCGGNENLTGGSYSVEYYIYTSYY